MILELDGVDTFYGTSHVLQGVSLGVDQGETVALLGRNGVGKTTTLRSIMGLTPPRRGSVRFAGEEIRGQPPDAISRRGLAYVPDDHRIFPTLTADENLEIARRLSPRRGDWDREKVLELFPKLRELARSRGTSLSGGEKKMLAIGRALMANPSLLLLDEPSEGLAPLVLAHLVEVLGRVRRQGVTILLADQNLRFCRKVCTRGYVLEKGRIQFSGSMEEIAASEEVVGKYLVV
ncbi:MAG TPA: ABC transporter ATP-binding protein [Anaeromyxobacteraceae bacterium]|nr:ABC transporter ATP-binding protein [Anaeromyxobacteraceae bacterium]